jgi:hypothetical protein
MTFDLSVSQASASEKPHSIGRDASVFGCFGSPYGCEDMSWNVME